MTGHAGENQDWQPWSIMQSWGLTVGPFGLSHGGFLFAEVEPAPRWNWRPWRGRRSRWWYEISEVKPGEEYMTTWVAVDGGSGGGFTLRSCTRRAQRALRTFQEADMDEHFGSNEESTT